MPTSSAHGTSPMAPPVLRPSPCPSPRPSCCSWRIVSCSAALSRFSSCRSPWMRCSWARSAAPSACNATASSSSTSSRRDAPPGAAMLVCDLVAYPGDAACEPMARLLPQVLPCRGRSTARTSARLAGGRSHAQLSRSSRLRLLPLTKSTSAGCILLGEAAGLCRDDHAARFGAVLRGARTLPVRPAERLRAGPCVLGRSVRRKASWESPGMRHSLSCRAPCRSCGRGGMDISLATPTQTSCKLRKPLVLL